MCSLIFFCSFTLVSCREIYHVEGYDIAERDLTLLVLLHKDAVDNLRATARGQAQHEWLLFSGSEGLDAAYMIKQTCQNGPLVLSLWS